MLSIQTSSMVKPQKNVVKIMTMKPPDRGVSGDS